MLYVCQYVVCIGSMYVSMLSVATHQNKVLEDIKQTAY